MCDISVARLNTRREHMMKIKIYFDSGIAGSDGQALKAQILE